MAMHNINNDSVLPNGKATTAKPREPMAIRPKNKVKQAAIDLFIFNFLSLGFIIRGLYFIPPSLKVQGVKY